MSLQEYFILRPAVAAIFQHLRLTIPAIPARLSASHPARLFASHPARLSASNPARLLHQIPLAFCITSRPRSCIKSCEDFCIKSCEDFCIKSREDFCTTSCGLSSCHISGSSCGSSTKVLVQQILPQLSPLDR